MEFLPSVVIEPCTMRFKYMFNVFPLPLELLISSGNELNMYLSPWYMIRFPRKTKTSLVKRGGEDREVALPELPKVVASELLQLTYKARYLKP
jgi:hypothetical protein